MDSGQELVLSKVLDASEVESIDLPIRKKLEKFYETKISEFFTAKAISETAQKSIGESVGYPIICPQTINSWKIAINHFHIRGA